MFSLPHAFASCDRLRCVQMNLNGQNPQDYCREGINRTQAEGSSILRSTNPEITLKTGANQQRESSVWDQLLLIGPTLFPKISKHNIFFFTQA